jgi:DNA polymerase III sliding clamp (beta) subunit (PCNA family)
LNIIDNKIISCDGVRMTQYEMENNIEQQFLMSVNIVKDLISYEPRMICIDNEWVHFKCKGNVIFSFRCVNGEYPDVSNLLGVEGHIVTFSNEFIGIINRVSIIHDKSFENDNTIDISINENKIICKGEGSSGWVEEIDDIEYSGEGIYFKVQPNFLKEVLSINNNVVIGENKLLFEGEKFKHILALMIEEN